MNRTIILAVLCVTPLVGQTTDVSPRNLQGANYLTTSTGGGGQAMWSGVSLDFASNATQFSPYGGGGITSITETQVSTKSSGPATISNLHVNLSAMLGASSTLTVTLENGTATASALTCTTGGGGTVCDDATHSVGVSNLALLSWKLVSSGSVSAGLANIKISYAVGSAISTSVNAASPITGDGSLGSPLSCATCTIAVSPAAGIARTVGSQTLTTSELSGDATTSGSNAVTLLAKYKIRGVAFTIGDPAAVNALSPGATTTDYVTIPYACTLAAYNVLVDQGTVTVKFWKVASGTSIPNSGNSINSSGVGVSSGTAIHSTVLSDFTTTAVAANDIIAMNVTAAASAKYVSGVLQCNQ